MFGKIKEAIENIFPSLLVGGEIEVVSFDGNRTVIVHRAGACNCSIMALKQGAETYLVKKLLVQQPWSKNRNNIISPFLRCRSLSLMPISLQNPFLFPWEKVYNTSEIEWDLSVGTTSRL